MGTLLGLLELKPVELAMLLASVTLVAMVALGFLI